MASQEPTLDSDGGSPAAATLLELASVCWDSSGTPWSDSLHLTQNSHLALFRAPQEGQMRTSEGFIVLF
jgi:hypothetical protein